MERLEHHIHTPWTVPTSNTKRTILYIIRRSSRRKLLATTVRAGRPETDSPCTAVCEKRPVEVSRATMMRKFETSELSPAVILVDFVVVGRHCPISCNKSQVTQPPSNYGYRCLLPGFTNGACIDAGACVTRLVKALLPPYLTTVCGSPRLNVDRLKYCMAALPHSSVITTALSFRDDNA